LLPGLFVQVRIAIAKPHPTLTVPDIAVIYDQIGAYLLVVDKNNTVISKRVETGALEKGARAIVKGLAAEDQVIISGLQYATPGNHVIPKMQLANEKAE
jgi:multidrug efflux pump subunit AcrA (membrane-fusion protein)